MKKRISTFFGRLFDSLQSNRKWINHLSSTGEDIRMDILIFGNAYFYMRKDFRGREHRIMLDPTNMITAISEMTNKETRIEKSDDIEIPNV